MAIMTATGPTSRPGEALRALAHEREVIEHTIESLEHDGLHLETEADSLSEISAAGQHPADVATETLEREVELGLLEDLRDQRAEVDEALHRLDEGRYGVCEHCGQPISVDRLEALPAARRCVECQQLLERWPAVGPPTGVPTLGAAAEFLPDDDATDDPATPWAEERAMQVVDDG